MLLCSEMIGFLFLFLFDDVRKLFILIFTSLSTGNLKVRQKHQHEYISLPNPNPNRMNVNFLRIFDFSQTDFLRKII